MNNAFISGFVKKAKIHNLTDSEIAELTKIAFNLKGMGKAVYEHGIKPVHKLPETAEKVHRLSLQHPHIIEEGLKNYFSGRSKHGKGFAEKQLHSHPHPYVRILDDYMTNARQTNKGLALGAGYGVAGALGLKHLLKKDKTN